MTRARKDHEYDLIIVLPVFRDWSSLSLLLGRLDAVLGKRALNTLALVVNDSVERNFDQGLLSASAGKLHLSVLNLTRNMGHQRAIAVGLSWARDNLSAKHFVVMDADGEDRPEDIEDLLEASEKLSDRIIFAKRSRRSEGIVFRAAYQVYKAIFRFFTGHVISFGNFCLIPAARLNDVVEVSEIWNHLAAGILRSRLPMTLVDTNRGHRLDGQSSMNLSSLVAHGLSAVSVFVDHLAVRLALLLGILLAVIVAAGIGVLGIRLLTDLAIPGWATTVFIGLSLMIMQLFIALLILIIIVLNFRNRADIIPSQAYRAFVYQLQPIKEK